MLLSVASVFQFAYKFLLPIYYPPIVHQLSKYCPPVICAMNVLRKILMRPCFSQCTYYTQWYQCLCYRTVALHFDATSSVKTQASNATFTVRISFIFSRSTLRNHFQFLVCFSKHKMKIKNFPFSSRVTRCWKKFLISSRKTRFSCIFLIVFFCQWFRNSLKCIDPFNTFRCPWLYEIHSEAFNTHEFSYIPPHT